MVEPDESDHDPEVQLPQFQASYDWALTEGLDWNLRGVYQTYDLEGGDGDSLDAWAVASNLRISEILEPLYLNLAGWYGENAHDFGNVFFDVEQSAEIDNGVVVDDTETYAFACIVGGYINNIRLEAGAGYIESDNDDWNDEVDTMAFYAQANIPLNEEGTFMVTPEIGHYDYGDDNDGDGDTTYFGLQTRVDF